MRAWMCGLIAIGTVGCEQIVGIHDPSSNSSGQDAPGGPGTKCSTAPAYANPVQYGGLSTTRSGDFPPLATGTLRAGGAIDVAVATGTDVVVGHGSPNGSLSAFTPLSGTAVPADGLIVVDTDGDALDDVIALRNTGFVSLVRQTSPGTFAAPVTTNVGNNFGVVSAKLDGDNLRDLLVGGDSGLQVWLGTGTGTYTAGTIVSGMDPRSPGVVDIDGDSLTDLATLEMPSGNLQIFFNASGAPGTFEAPVRVGPSNTQFIVLGTIDAARKDVILQIRNTRAVLRFAQTAPRVFVEGPSIPYTSGPDLTGTNGGGAAGEVLDVNGDGRNDIVAGVALAVLQCPPDGTAVVFDPSPTTLGDFTMIIDGQAFADLDHNGKLDLLQLEGDQLKVFLQ